MKNKNYRKPKEALAFFELNLQLAYLKFYSIFMFYQIGLLQVWQSVVSTQWPISFLIQMGIGTGLVIQYHFLKGICRQSPNELMDELKKAEFGNGNINTKGFNLSHNYLCLLMCLGVIAWGVFSLPYLDLPIHTWGDEDHHFTVARDQIEFVWNYFRGQWPIGPAPGVYRYPNLMNFLSGLFVNPLWNNTSSYSAHRVWLLGIFILTIFWSWIFSKQVLFTENSHQLAVRWRRLSVGILTLIIATSPVLLSFTVDKYLDIGHPLFVLVAHYYLYRYLLSPLDLQSKIYCLISSCLLFFIRDNSLPISLSFFMAICLRDFGQFKGTFLEGLKSGGSCHRRFCRDIFCNFLIGLLPILIYLFFKSKAPGYVDGRRLNFVNISLQRWDYFFLFLPFYIPISIVAVPTFFKKSWRFIWIKQELLLSLLVIVLSISGCLIMYGLFEPGWMPWSRNYLMFYGSVFSLVVLLISSIFGVYEEELVQQGNRKNLILKRVKIILLSLGLVGVIQIFQLIFFFKDNRFFHENENVFNYKAVNQSISESVHSQQKVCSSVPYVIPLSWEWAGFAPQAIYYDPRMEIASANMMGLEDLLARVPAECRFVVWHFRENFGFIEKISNMPQAPLSSNIYQMLGKYNLLKIIYDPWSKERSGVLLLEKK